MQGDWRPGNVEVDVAAIARRLAAQTRLDAAEIEPLVAVLVLEADIRVGTPRDTVDFILQEVEARALRTLRLGEVHHHRGDVALPGVGRAFDDRARAMMWMTGARPGGVQRRGVAPSPGGAESNTRLGRRAEDKSATVGLVPFLR